MELVERHRTRTPQSTRLAALEQLLRIEYEGAYVGMVGGSPTYPSEKPTTLTGRYGVGGLWGGGYTNAYMKYYTLHESPKCMLESHSWYHTHTHTHTHMIPPTTTPTHAPHVHVHPCSHPPCSTHAPPPTHRDARFVTEIVAGVTRMHKQLDYILAQLLQGKRLEGLDVPVHIILRIGMGGEMGGMGVEYMWEGGCDSRVCVY